MYHLYGVHGQDKLKPVHFSPTLEDCELILSYTIKKDQILAYGMEILVL
jgi:hypothetical protein